MQKIASTHYVNDLKSAGLSDKAAQIYGALLEIGGAYPSKIAAVTKLNRSTVYMILTDLAVKGLVSGVEKSKKLFYTAEHPRKLAAFSRMQISMAEDRYEKAKKIIPELEGLFGARPTKPLVRFFEGREGVLDVYADHVAEEKSYEMVAWAQVDVLAPQVLPPKFYHHYLARKRILKISTRAFVPNTPMGHTFNKNVYRGMPPSLMPKLKFIPAKIFTFPSEITVYGDRKISLINFNHGVYVGIIIEDAILHGMLRMIFEQAWNA